MGKTGAYLQFLRILFRMLIRLLEVDVYDENEVEDEEGQYCLHFVDKNVICLRQISRIIYLPIETSISSPVNTMWPDIEEILKFPFDFFPRDPKFKKASPVYSEKMPKCLKGLQKCTSWGSCFHAVFIQLTRT